MKTQSAGNQRRYKSSQVGTSETLRVKLNNDRFSQWLGGIIDGDGYIQVSKKGYTSLEITMGIEDLSLLRYIQNKLGGSIKLRSGAKAYRYRLHNKEGMIKLFSFINGHIYNTARLAQLHRASQILNVPIISSIPLDFNNNWFGGIFDSDGTITFSLKNNIPQLSIRVVAKLLVNIQPFQSILGGSIYYDNSQYGCYVWSIQKREDIDKFLLYFKDNIFKSNKSKRIFLIKEYYKLYDLRAYNPESDYNKVWTLFLDKWNYKLR